MKVHLFYRKQDDDLNLPLYAFTNNKKFAEEFQLQRDMSKFIYKKEILDKKDFLKFSDAHRDALLHDGQFYTQSKKNYGEFTHVHVLCTMGEEFMITKMEDRLGDEFTKYLFDASVFSDEIVKALKSLLYFEFYGFYVLYNSHYGDSYYRPYFSGISDDDGDIIPPGQYKLDELALFLHFFHSTFRVKDE